MDCSSFSTESNFGFHFLESATHEEILKEFALLKTTIGSLSNLKLNSKLIEDENQTPYFTLTDHTYSKFNLRSEYRMLELGKINQLFKQRIKALQGCLYTCQDAKFIHNAFAISSELRDLFVKQQGHLDQFSQEILTDDNPTWRLPTDYLATTKESFSRQVQSYKRSLDMLTAGIHHIIHEKFDSLPSLPPPRPIKPLPKLTLPSETAAPITKIAVETTTTLPGTIKLTLEPTVLSTETTKPAPKVSVLTIPTPPQPAKEATPRQNFPVKVTTSPIEVTPLLVPDTPDINATQLSAFDPSSYHHFAFCIHPAFCGIKGYEILPCNQEKFGNMTALDFQMAQKNLLSQAKTLKEAYEEYRLALKAFEEAEIKANLVFASTKKAEAKPANKVIPGGIPLPPPLPNQRSNKTGTATPPPPGPPPGLNTKSSIPLPPPLPGMHKKAQAQAEDKGKEKESKTEDRKIEESQSVKDVKTYILKEQIVREAKSSLLRLLVPEFQTRDLSDEDITLLYENFQKDAEIANQHMMVQVDRSPQSSPDKEKDELKEKINQLKSAAGTLRSILNRMQSLAKEKKAAEDSLYQIQELCTKEPNLENVTKLMETEKKLSEDEIKWRTSSRQMDKDLQSTMRALRTSLGIGAKENLTAQELLARAQGAINSYTQTSTR